MASEVTQIDAQGAEAIRLYTSLLKAYPDYPRNDQVLYQLARAYETTGQPEQALSTLDSIVARYPQQSATSPRCSSAAASCCSPRSAMPRPSRPTRQVLRARARRFGLLRAEPLQARLVAVQARTQRGQPGSFADLLDLRAARSAQSRADARLEFARPGRPRTGEDTLRVMSITFSYLDGAKSLDEFAAAPRPACRYACLLYSRLGDLYVEKQRYQDAAATYRAFVSRDPVDEHAPVCDGRDRGLSQGRLCRPHARGQARVRAALRLRRSRSGRAASIARFRRSSTSSRST